MAKTKVSKTSDSEMVLVRRGEDIAIRIGQRTLMSSDVHDSEDELGRIVAAAVVAVAKPRILIGGLGLGFTPAYHARWTAARRSRGCGGARARGRALEPGGAW